jgi:Coenzyme PQQ synthesis protein D (PqqD)
VERFVLDQLEDRVEHDVNAEWREASRTLRRHLLDGALLLPYGADEPISLNSSAAEIWESLQQPESTEAVVAQLAARHGLAADDLRDEVTRAIDGLVAVGAVDAISAPGRTEPAA